MGKIIDIHTGEEVFEIVEENKSWFSRYKKIIMNFLLTVVGYTVANYLIGQAFDMDALHTFYLVIGYMIATATYNFFGKNVMN